MTTGQDMRARAHVVERHQTQWQLHPEVRLSDPLGRYVAPVAFAGICGSDLNALTRHVSPETLRDGRVLGHEVVLGPTADRPGYAAVDPLLPCTICLDCRAGRTHLCPVLRRVGDELAGGFASHLAVPASQIHPLPARVRPECAVLADPLAVALHALHDLDPSDGPAVVVGSGTVALLAARLLQHRGLDVHVASRSDVRRAWVRDNLGFDSIRRPDDLQVRPGVVVEARGGASTDWLTEYLPLVRPGGRVRVVGAFAADVALAVPVRRWVASEVGLRGVYSHCAQGGGDFVRAMQLLADPSLADGLDAIVTHRFPLPRLAEAIEVCKRVDEFVGKVVLVGEEG